MDALPNGLQLGDEIRCPICRQWHPVHRSDNTHGSTPYTRTMLYWTCRAHVFFAGTIGRPCRHPVRRPEA